MSNYTVSITSPEQFYPQQEICQNCLELNRSYRNMIESEKLRFFNEKLEEINQLKKQLDNEQKERLCLEKMVKDNLETIETQSANFKKMEEENFQLKTNLNACKTLLKREIRVV